MPSRRKIWGSEDGNVAVLFGLAVVPLIAMAGGAVDFAHRANVRTQVQAAADTAALAAAQILQHGQTADEKKWGALKAKARQAAENVFAATVANSGAASGHAPAIHIDDEIVRVTADLDVPTSFLGVLGIESLEAGALAEVNVPDPLVAEIAFVLDYSKSMKDNDKYARMTTAATEFIQKVSATRADRTKIAVVPFSEFVYATLPSGYVRGTDGGKAKLPLTTCLKNRGYPYSATDEAPLSGVAASRWPQSAAQGKACQAYAANSLAVIDLTNDFAGLQTALAKMRPTYLTNITLGAEIGWHVLSPGEPFDSARDPSDPLLRKVLILLTDGMQTVKAEGPGGQVSTEAADETTAEICDNMDKDGIRVFTIAYDIADERVRSLLSGCASDASTYHEATGADDVARVFEDIYAQVTESVWLSR